MVKRIKKCLILILGTLSLVLGFQNCQKSQSSDSSSLNCASINSAECLALNSSAKSLNVNLANSVLYLGLDNGAMNYQFQISLSTDQVVLQNSSPSCTLKLNSKWQEAKALFLNGGLCHFTFEHPAGTANCMAYALPYAKVSDSGQNDVNISLSICQQDFDNLCSYDDANKFRNLLQDVQNQLSQNQGCD